MIGIIGRDKVRFFPPQLFLFLGLVILLSLSFSSVSSHEQVTLASHIGQFLDDSQVTAKVKSALLNQKQLSMKDLQVTTEQGIVTIRGQVERQKSRREIKKCAAKIPGVKHVINRVKVQAVRPNTLQSYARDLAITSEIKTRLLADKNIASCHIRIQTHLQNVTIQGQVADRREKFLVSQLIRQVADVLKVDNHLTVSHRDRIC